MLAKRLPCRTARILGRLATGIAVAFLAAAGMTAMVRADTESYAKTAQVDVPSNPDKCDFRGFATSPGFTSDISWLDPSLVQDLLAAGSRGTPASSTQGPRLTNATSGGPLVIGTHDPGAGRIILPPANGPFAGDRCEAKTDFDGALGGSARRPMSDSNEISGSGGVFAVSAVSRPGWATGPPT